MPGSNIENIVNQKLQGMEMRPAEADWDAIHERLHPKKRRRIIFWWWLPLAGALLLGGGYYALKGNGTSGADHNNATVLVNNNAGNGNNSAAAPETNTSATDPSTASTPAAEGSSTIPSTATDIDGSTGSGSGNNGADNNGTNLGSGKSSPAPNGTTASSPYKRSGAKRSGQKTSDNIPSASATVEENKPSETASPAVQPEKAAPPAETPMDVDSVPSNPGSPIPTAEQKAPVNSPLKPDSAETKAIPNTSTHKNKGWYLGVYGGVGMNMVNENTGSRKSINATNSVNGAYVNNQTLAYIRNGYHVEAGLVLQKKYKKFEWSIGAGMQRNTWTQAFDLTRDSIQPSGATYSRSSLGSKETKYEHVAVELPLMAGFRISEKGANSFWVNAGINNAFTIYTKELSYVITGNLPGGAFIDPLTSPINKYHPQLRVGLTYNRAAAKYHWQLAPFMQYSLASVAASGTPDIRMMHVGLQFRYYLFKLR